MTATGSSKQMDLTFPDLYRLRDELAGVTARIVALIPARDQLASRSGHTDEITARFRRGLDAATHDYEARLSVFFHDPRRGDVSQLLTDGAAIYYMRDLVASKLPALIKRLSPMADRAMPPAEQQQALRTANAELSALIDQHGDLVRAFGQQKLILRDMRQPSNLRLGEDGRRDRAAIESEELDLIGEMETMRADQARFANQRVAPADHG